MRKIVIVHGNSSQALLLQDFLNLIPGVLVAGMFLSLTDAEPFLSEDNCDILFGSLPVVISCMNKGGHLPILVCMEDDEKMLPSPVSRNIFAWLHVPFTFERIVSLVQNIDFHMFHNATATAEKKDFVFIKSDYKLVKVNLSDILYLSGLRDYTQVYLKGKTSPLTTLQNLKEFEGKLPETDFIRIHRSYIISLGQVDAISRNEVIIGQHIIPIGNAYRPLLDRFIKKNS